MKIRTITTGFNLRLPIKSKQIKRIGEFTNNARNIFEKNGHVVQTIRIATQPWEKYFQSKNKMLDVVKRLEILVDEYNIDYFNIGITTNPKNIPFIYDLIKNSKKMCCTASITDGKKINYESAKQTAKLIKRISTISNDGFDNLRFAALFNTGPGSPFYPAAYHDGPTSFAIGTENSNLVNKAFSKSRDIEKAESSLIKTLSMNYKKIEKIAQTISRKEKVKYNGIDVSIATSVNPNESIAYAFEKLGLGKFGDVGTLTIARIVTEALKKVNVKKCGYSGLMLPVLEDYGLAERNTEEKYNLSNLLLYSAVCGTGLDTIPLPGVVSEKKLYALLLDVASLSIKLNKPLSARLMPVPGKKYTEKTDFKFEYFANSNIMKI